MPFGFRFNTQVIAKDRKASQIAGFYLMAQALPLRSTGGNLL